MKNDKIKRILVKEFRELGFLQEINRRLLHPCGLALEVVIDLETGEEKLGGIWDYRDDPEGMYFGEINTAKAKSVDALFISKEKERLAKFGYLVQPASTEE